MSLNAEIYRVQTQKFKANNKKKLLGGCGEVFFVTEKATRRQCVVKKTKLLTNEKLFKQEVEVLSSCHHPAIIEFIGFAIDGKKGNIYLKEAEKGSLESCITKNKTELQGDSYKEGFTPLWDDTHKLIIAYGVACAMEYLHSKNILHRDLKAENILIDNDLFPYITDFGTSKLVDDIKSSQTIKQTTAIIMPPEFLNDYDKYNRSLPIDVYSYAIVLYRLWTELRVFPGLPDMKILQLIINGKRPEIPKGNYPSENWINLIKECWSQEPEKRPTFKEICDRLESAEFQTSNIDTKLFEEYKKRCRTDPKNASSDEDTQLFHPALLRGSITAMLSHGNLCEKDPTKGCPEIFYEMAANCCHCLDKEGFFFPADYKIFKCEDCNMEICEGCAKNCHKGHNIVEAGTKNSFVCDCGKNHFTDKRGRKHCSIEFVGEMKYKGKPVCHQHFYKCLDCQPEKNIGDDEDDEEEVKYICQGCAEKCHKNHNLVDCGVTTGYCSCGANEFGNTCKCRAVYYTKTTPGICTCNQSNQPVAQRWFQCASCMLIKSNEEGICKSCAEECHQGHDLLDRGVRRTRCQCQKSGKCKLSE